MKNTFFVLMAAALCGAVLSSQTPAIPEAEKEAIVRTALDYGDGFYSGAAERMERAIHPDLNEVYVSALPRTGKVVVGYSTYSGLIEMTRAKVGLVEPRSRSSTSWTGWRSWRSRRRIPGTISR